MYIYSKRRYLSFSGKYAWGILGVLLGYAWGRSRSGLDFDSKTAVYWRRTLRMKKHIFSRKKCTRMEGNVVISRAPTLM